MNQEDKKLLLIVLSTMLPYATKVFYEYVDDLDKKTYGYSLTLNTWCIDELVAEKAIIKPYLRPMSSMTEGEKKDLLEAVVGKDGVKYFQVLSDGSIDNTDATIQDLNKFNMHWINFDKDNVTSYLDWLNAHHFDFRNLIERGLAIEVTEENNPYKE